MPVFAVFVAEPLLQFPIFQSDHDGAGKQSERGQCKADHQSSPDAPRRHLAQVSQINGMTNPGANARCGKALFAMSGDEFGKASELSSAETSS